ncbi:MAG TPA: DUF2652 domain-containing protein [Anaerolineales bacterium]|nr:DUF2652 domain-containing protein [Anaerolineales bacterium]
MANKGYFVITDISGYTEYLTGSELDHANEILQSLFDAQLKAVKHPFIISGFRGDAIFMYVPETNFVQSQSFLEALENFYIVFAETLEQMQYNTTCTCRACKNMSILDLKMCIHFGEYLIQKLGDREELLGADVIVPHRMLKNHVIEQTGIKSYALFSDVAARQLSLAGYCENLVPHVEMYEHLGEVPMCVHDLQTVWEKYQAKNRKFVDEKDAWVKCEVDLPFPAALVREYLTKPDLEAGFLKYDYGERTDANGGRVREGSGFHCAHGDLHVYSQILDWKPFEYYTMEQTAMGLSYISTRRLTPAKNGTRVGIYLTMPEETSSNEVRQIFQSAMEDGYAGLRAYIEQDIADGKVTVGNNTTGH